VLLCGQTSYTPHNRKLCGMLPGTEDPWRLLKQAHDKMALKSHVR
jgi:hypothetical protein